MENHPRHRMSRRQALFALAGGLAAACSSSTPGTLTPLIPLPTDPLARMLVSGGFVIYCRHAIADVGSDTRSFEGWWRSCDNTVARQLSDAGRAQATRIGSDIRALGIPIGQVISSEFCRCVQTAELLNLGPMVETTLDLTFTLTPFDSGEGPAALLRIPPASGQNTVLVAHVINTSLAPELGSLGQGDAAVYRPDGMGGTQFVDYILAEDWSGLA